MEKERKKAKKGRRDRKEKNRNKKEGRKKEIREGGWEETEAERHRKEEQNLLLYFSRSVAKLFVVMPYYSSY